MPPALSNLTQNAVEHEVAQQYRAAGGAAAPRVVNIQNWTASRSQRGFYTSLWS
jgi:hypothetical protein